MPTLPVRLLHCTPVDNPINLSALTALASSYHLQFNLLDPLPMVIQTFIPKKHTPRIVWIISLVCHHDGVVCFPSILSALVVREKWRLTMFIFFYKYKVFWSFLHDFNLLNPNPWSARCKSLSCIRAQRWILERLLIFGGHLGFLRQYKIAQTFASGTQRIWIQQVEIM